MYTAKEAQELWCPMARVAQIGVIETAASYNRALVKSHIPIALADPDDPEKTVQTAALRTEVQYSAAAHCVGNKCAVWVWIDRNPERLLVYAQNHSATIEAEAGPRPLRAKPSYTFCPAEDDSAAWVEPAESAAARRVGRCGMVAP